MTHSSPTHGAALVSLPALGLMQGRRLADTVADAVGVIAGDHARGDEPTQSGDQRLIQRRLVELASDVDNAEAFDGVALMRRVVSGNVSLLAGMIRANHPLRLATRLSRALIGAISAAAFGLVTSDVWRIASRLAVPRLVAVCALTIVVCVWTLVVAHKLWERPPAGRAREQTIMFNVVTVITLGIGILALYAAVCLLSLISAWLMIEPALMSRSIGHASAPADYLRLALLGSALGTVGGALGGALESDAAVREATYAYRHDRR
jgi:uncharacterized membrane protein